MPKQWPAGRLRPLPRPLRTNGDRLRSFLRDRARDRGGARRGRCERRHVRPAPRDARARGRAARRPRRPRRPDQPGRPPAARRSDPRGVRRHRHPRQQRRRPTARDGAEVTDEAVEGAVELLLVSAVRLTNLCLPQLRRSGHGRVVNITSSSVREPIDNLALSNAVRPGVIGWAKTLAREVGPDGITVNSIAPGRIDTERLAEVYVNAPAPTTSRRSRSAASAGRARSPTSSASSPPTGRRTSPAR